MAKLGDRHLGHGQVYETPATAVVIRGLTFELSRPWRQGSLAGAGRLEGLGVISDPAHRDVRFSGFCHAVHL